MPILILVVLSLQKIQGRLDKAGMYHSLWLILAIVRVGVISHAGQYFQCHFLQKLQEKHKFRFFCYGKPKMLSSPCLFPVNGGAAWYPILSKHLCAYQDSAGRLRSIISVCCLLAPFALILGAVWIPLEVSWASCSSCVLGCCWRPVGYIQPVGWPSSACLSEGGRRHPFGQHWS